MSENYHAILFPHKDDPEDYGEVKDDDTESEEEGEEPAQDSALTTSVSSVYCQLLVDLVL